MDIKLDKNTVGCFEAVFDRTLTQEEKTECVVPDTEPDILNIVRTEGVALIRSKDVAEGCISVEGTISATVLYAHEEGSGLRSIAVQIPFEASAQSPEISSGGASVVNIRVRAIDSRMLNPRKISVRAELELRFRSFEPGEISCAAGVIGESGVYLKREKLLASLVTDVTEKTFVITDEYAVPPSMPAIGEILDARARLISGECKAVGSKLILRGSAAVDMLYSPDFDGADNAVSFSTVFSQIIELGSEADSPEAEVALMLSGAWFEAIGDEDAKRSVNIELHVVAQAIVSEHAELDYISDAYSSSYELEMQTKRFELRRIEKRLSLRETVKETVELHEAPRELLSASVSFGSISLSGTALNIGLDVHLICIGEDGCAFGATARLKLQRDIEIPSDLTAEIVSVSCADIYAAPNGKSVELRLPVDIELLIRSGFSESAVCAISYDEEAQKDLSALPSLVVIRGGNYDLWELSKRYNSSPEAIAAANPSVEGDFAEHEILLIPKVLR